MASSPTPSDVAPDDRPHAALIREHTVVAAPYLVPEVRLHLVTPKCALWKATDDDLERLELPAPYWAFAWAGGQAIARAILDGKIDVAGKRVVDFGAGSGLIAIAAMLRGATCALAADVDPFAAIACRMNAALNGVELETTVVDLVGREVNADVVFAGDVTYASDLAAAVRTWLHALVAAGRRIYVGDPGRGFLDTEGLERVATIDAPSDVDVDGQYLIPTPIYTWARPVEFGVVPTRRRSLDEALHDANGPVGPKLVDFWQWSASNLVDNTTRGVLAEFIVATALGVAGGVRNAWDAYDLRLPDDDVKVEVKSSAYVQAWAQNRQSTPQFSVGLTREWSAETNALGSTPRRSADVYIFCLLAHRDQATIDPLDLDQWRFYVVSTRALEREIGEQKTLSLRRLESFAGAHVPYRELLSATRSTARESR